MNRAFIAPAGLALAAVLALCVVAPPEVFGAAWAAVALLTTIAAVAVSASAASLPATIWLAAAIPLTLVAQRMAIAPGESIAPAVCVLLALVAGICAASAPRQDEVFARTFAVLVAFAGGRALYETLWRLSSLADRVRESAPTGEMLTVLSRLEQGRPYGGFATPAALGCFLVIAIPTVAAWALGKRGVSRAVGLTAAALGAAGLVATRSVTAMAALGVALALAGLRGRVAPRILAGSAGAIMLAIVAVGALRPDAVFSPNRGDSPWRLRAGNVRIALEIAHDHPLAGVGPGGFAEAFPQYRRPGDNESRHAHDLPAELAAEWGVPLGLLLSAGFFWVFVGPVVRSAGDSRSFTSGLSVGLAAFGLHNLADFTAFFPSLLTLAAVGRGLIANRTHRETASPAARAGWVLVVVAIAVAATRVGLARDALFQAREEAKAGNHEEALRFAQRAETLAPWDADPPQFAAEARMVRGDGAGALKDAERAVYRAPSRASARVVRARARAASGDSSGAYADLVEAEKLYPAHPDYAKQRDALAAAIEQARQAAPR